MWAEDDASKGLGMEIVEIGPGYATLAMTVRPDMVNGQRIAHGGFIFTLADSAFAFACNSHNERVVAAQGQITFIKPGKLGDRLVAKAREVTPRRPLRHLRRARHRRRHSHRRIPRAFAGHSRHVAAGARSIKNKKNQSMRGNEDGSDEAQGRWQRLSRRDGCA